MADKKSVWAAVVCHKGCARANNEDNFFFNGSLMALENMNEGVLMEHTFTQKVHVFAVFDGMGGGDCGERASAIAAQTMQNMYTHRSAPGVSKMLKDYITKINDRIVRDAQRYKADTEGTTAAILMLRDGFSYVTNVGDSRVYRLRKGALEQLSTDHSVVGELVQQGKYTPEQARKAENNNIITSYLGMLPEDISQQKVSQVKLEAELGDRYLVCSDGLYDLMSDEDIRARLVSFASPLDCARTLVEDALELSGKDNVTCIVADNGTFHADPTPVTPAWLQDGETQEVPSVTQPVKAPEVEKAQYSVLNTQPIEGTLASARKNKE